MPEELTNQQSVTHATPTREPYLPEAPAQLTPLFADRLGELRNAKDRAARLAAIIDSSTELTAANLVLMAQTIFDELLKPEGERDKALLTKYMSAALKARDQEIRLKSLQLSEDRFHFNAAKAVLRETTRLKEIADSPEEEQAKIDKVMLLLFGPEPDRFVVPPGKENE